MATDPKALAEKIVLWVCNNRDNKVVYEETVRQVNVLLAEAMEGKTCSHCAGVLEKHQLKFYRGCLCQCHQGAINEVVAEAYEHAAQVIEKYKGPLDQSLSTKYIADLVRAEKGACDGT